MTYEDVHEEEVKISDKAYEMAKRVLDDAESRYKHVLREKTRRQEDSVIR